METEEARLRTEGDAQFKACRGAQERENLARLAIPEKLLSEEISWENLEQDAKVNFSIIKSYVDEFKSIRDEILIQLSIVKNLIALGGVKIDPEAVRALHIIDEAYKPSKEDYLQRQENIEAENSTVSYEEGVVKL